MLILGKPYPYAIQQGEYEEEGGIQNGMKVCFTYSKALANIGISTLVASYQAVRTEKRNMASVLQHLIGSLVKIHVLILKKQMFRPKIE